MISKLVSTKLHLKKKFNMVFFPKTSLHMLKVLYSLTIEHMYVPIDEANS